MKIGKPKKIETDIPEPVRVPRRDPTPLPPTPAPTPREPAKTPGGYLDLSNYVGPSGYLEAISLDAPILCPVDSCRKPLQTMEGDAGLILACKTHGPLVSLTRRY